MLLVAGCDEKLTVSGHYAGGFEYSGFIPCGEHNGWWLTKNEGFHERYIGLIGKSKNPMTLSGRVYIRVKGIRKGPGKFGHLGAWKHEFIVEEVLEMRLPTDSDCQE